MKKRVWIPIVIILVLVLGGGFYFVRMLFRSFAPPQITVTRDAITTTDRFVNGVTIAKLTVDSIGADKYPVLYTVVYKTHCELTRKPDAQSPDRIGFRERGAYSWREDTSRIRYQLPGMPGKPLDADNNSGRPAYFGDHAICPLQFEVGQWYLATVSDPRVTAVFFYMDWRDEVFQFPMYSGISPI